MVRPSAVIILYIDAQTPRSPFLTLICLMCYASICRRFFCFIVILSLHDEQKDVDYDWLSDDAIWSSHDDGTRAIQSGKWRVMLVDFGFARALEREELESQSKKMRSSILFEGSPPPVPELGESKSYTPRSMYPSTIAEGESNVLVASDDDSVAADLEKLESMVTQAAENLRKSHFEAQSSAEEAVMGEQAETVRERQSGVSMAVQQLKPNHRMSRLHLRSLSALGTKAYAAPEIRRQLRKKTEADFDKANAAMTECVADYGMIVDAYSVGWTLRVAMTGAFLLLRYQENVRMTLNFSHINFRRASELYNFGIPFRTRGGPFGG